MRTIGVDVSSQPRGTVSCEIDWGGASARIDSVERALDDARLETILSAGVDKIGVDVPLGWPESFVDAVVRHRDGKEFGEAPIAKLARRATDLWVWENTGQLPLSVSTDRISYPAMRIARMLGRLPSLGCDRSGAGKLVEVYPAAALRVWGLQHERYKRDKGREALAAILQELRARCPWLSAHRDVWVQLESDDHCFDSLISSLVARAHALARCQPIPQQFVCAAEHEGWIAVPKQGTLETLIG